jgi:hypothetical protein
VLPALFSLRIFVPRVVAAHAPSANSRQTHQNDALRAQNAQAVATISQLDEQIVRAQLPSSGALHA